MSPARTRRSRRPLLGILVVVVTLGTALVACGGDETPDELAGVQRIPLPEVGDHALPDASADGEAFPFVARPDGLLVVYFGYTSCPDVCPTTMADLRSALADLGDDADSIDVAMVTIDPDRDTAEVLSGYVRSFVADAHALRTDDDEPLRAAADAFGADYSVTVDDEGAIEVVHTGFLYVVDDQGRLLVTWPFGMAADDMAADLGILSEDITA